VSNIKIGDKVWVLCEVLEQEHRGCIKCVSHNYVLHPYVDEIRPVEPSNNPETSDSSSDPINPSHYKHLPSEAIDIIEAAIAGAPSNKAAYLHGQSLKYPLRCWEKGGVDDLKKARWYLDRLIKEVSE
jgi:hypothetical protein